MQQPTDNTDGSVRASGHGGADPMPQPGRNRTGAAAREFFRALGSDLAGLALRIRQYHWRHRWAMRTQAADATSSATSSKIRRRSFVRATAVVIRRYTIGIIVLATVGALALSGAMLWAIHDMPLERPSDA